MSRHYESETTEQGEQTLVPGVQPVTIREKLERLMAGPMFPRRAQKPCNVGLFDADARAQLDMFIRTGPKEDRS